MSEIFEKYLEAEKTSEAQKALCALAAQAKELALFAAAKETCPKDFIVFRMSIYDTVGRPLSTLLVATRGEQNIYFRALLKNSRKSKHLVAHKLDFTGGLSAKRFEGELYQFLYKVDAPERGTWKKLG